MGVTEKVTALEHAIDLIKISLKTPKTPAKVCSAPPTQTESTRAPDDAPDDEDEIVIDVDVQVPPSDISINSVEELMPEDDHLNSSVPTNQQILLVQNSQQ